MVRHVANRSASRPQHRRPAAGQLVRDRTAMLAVPTVLRPAPPTVWLRMRLRKHHGGLMPGSGSTVTLLAIHISSKTNLGDAVSTPVLYFQAFQERFDIGTISIASRDRIAAIPAYAPVLLGGGGLLAGKPEWDAAALGRTSYAIAWGVGLNRSRKIAHLPAQISAFLAHFRHIGLRDWLPADGIQLPP